MKDLNSSDFDQEVINAKGKTAVEFWADWCGSCKMFAPVLEQAEKELKSVKLLRINVDECADIAREYNVMSVPVIMLFENGNVKSVLEGSHSKAEVLKFLEG